MGGRIFIPARIVVATLMAYFLPVGAGADSDGEKFVEKGQALGVDFVHQDGRDGQYHFIETAASGGGWLDYDDDGDPDLYLINAAPRPGSSVEQVINTLYENRDGRFFDVTHEAGVGDTGYGMGMCVGDYDSDGRLDFLVTNYGPDRLYRNLGNGRFEETAEQAGVAESLWSTACSFADLDGDGDLDLYVVHYVAYDRAAQPACTPGPDGKTGYCHPIAYRAQPDSLFINQGNGKFVEAGADRGIDQGNSDRGFGLVISDLNDDGHADIYVANDGSLNRVYLNSGKGVFSDHSMLSGAGLNLSGLAEAGMGVDLGDVDGDGRQDLYVSHFAMESNTLYRQIDAGVYEDATRRFGLSKPSYLYVGWGVKFLDYDNDGDLDLAVANGHVQDRIAEIEPRLSYPQRNQLYENLGQRFAPATSTGSAWQSSSVSRGLATADFNSDGKLDVLVTNTNARPDLIVNQHPQPGNWLGIQLVGPQSNRFAINARIVLKAGELTQVREVRSGDSFLSQSELRQHFGLGDFTGDVAVQINWPDGHQQNHSTSDINRYWTINYQRPAD